MEVAYFIGLEISISLSNVQIEETWIREEILKILVPCELCKILLNLHSEIDVHKFCNCQYGIPFPGGNLDPSLSLLVSDTKVTFLWRKKIKPIFSDQNVPSIHFYPQCPFSVTIHRLVWKSSKTSTTYFPRAPTCSRKVSWAGGRLVPGGPGTAKMLVYRWWY